MNPIVAGPGHTQELDLARCPYKKLQFGLTSSWNHNCLHMAIELIFFSCPSEKRGTALLVASSLTDYYTLLKNTTIEHSERLVTLETCDQSDEET